MVRTLGVVHVGRNLRVGDLIEDGNVRSVSVVVGNFYQIV
jgi:hypothetical protein